jgi:hypothetical protein
MYQLHAVLLSGGILGVEIACADSSELYTPAFQNSTQPSHQLSLLNSSIIELTSISVFELSPSRAESVSTSYQGFASTQSGSLVVDMTMTVPDLPVYVRREVPALWRLVMPAGVRQQDLPLEFQWEMVPDVKSQRGAESFVEPLIHPWIHREERDDQGMLIIEGGVFLDIPVDSLQNQTLSGRILILSREF